MNYIDGFLVPFLIGIPVVGAIFVTLMPGSDRIALRHVGMGATIANALVALRATINVLGQQASPTEIPERFEFLGLTFGFQIDAVNVFAVFGCALLMPMALRAGAPRVHEETKGYVAGLLICEALVIAALCAASPLNAFVLTSALTYPLMLLLGISGGATKGSTALRMGTLWAVVDAFALASLVWLEVSARRQGIVLTIATQFDVVAKLSFFEQALLSAPLLVAATTRMACLPLTAWVDPFFEDAPVSIAAVMVGAVVPLGAVLAFRYGLVWMPRGGLFWLPLLAVLSILTALLGGIRGWIERDLRRHCAGVTELVGAITLAGLCAMEPFGVSAALTFVTASGLALAMYLFVIDAIERRYVTRDSVELIGLAEQLPGLWRLFALSNIAIVGVPLLAGGTAMWMVLVSAFQSPVLHAAGAPPSLAPWLASACIFGATLCGIGAGAHLRRTAAPIVRSTLAIPSPLTSGQAARLWIPALFAVAIGLLTTTLVPRISPDVTTTLDAMAKSLDRGPEGRRFEGFRPAGRSRAQSSSADDVNRNRSAPRSP